MARNRTSTRRRRGHDPWRDPVSTPYATVVRQHRRTFNGVEMELDHEQAIYRPVNTVLTYQAMTHSQWLALTTNRYLTIGPQSPVYAHGKPTPLSAPPADGIAHNVKTAPRLRVQTDTETLVETDAAYKRRLKEQLPRKLWRNDDDRAAILDEFNDPSADLVPDDPSWDASQDISAPEGLSTNPSAPISQPPSAYCLIDFNIYVNDSESNTSGVVASIVEIKALPKSALDLGQETEHVVADVMDSMLPQVIQYVQFVFAEYPFLDEVHALLFVSSWCKSLRYRRKNVPELPHVDDIPKNGFVPSTDRRRRNMRDFAEKKGRESFRIFGEDGDYNPAFKAAFDKIARYAKKVNLGI